MGNLFNSQPDEQPRPLNLFRDLSLSLAPYQGIVIELKPVE